MVDTRSKKRELENGENVIEDTKKLKIENEEMNLELDISETTTESEFTEELESRISSDQENEIKFQNVGRSLVDTIKNIANNSLFGSLSRYKKPDFEVAEIDTEEIEETEMQENESDSEPTNSELKKFKRYMKEIKNGKFFKKPSEISLANEYDEQELYEFNDELQRLKIKHTDCPSIIDILKLETDDDNKIKLLEKLYIIKSCELFSPEYKYYLETLQNDIDFINNKLSDLEKELVHVKIQDNCYKTRILNSRMNKNNKMIALKELRAFEGYKDGDSSEYSKRKEWLESLLNIPFGTYIDTIPELKYVRETLDEKIMYMEEAKDVIINIVAKISRNNNFSLNAIGIQGKPGIGKTAFTKTLAKTLNRPLKMISLGGEHDAALLTGHGFTYVGSTQGKLTSILSETKCMNPIIMIDELDKISKTENGKDITGTLIHLTDMTTNMNFNHSKYFSGIEFDFSKVLFVFTYNDESCIDPILLDRLLKIRLKDYSHNEKFNIVKYKILDEILSEYGRSENLLDWIQIDDDVITKLISETSESGLRGVKSKLETIVSRVNLLTLNPEVIKLSYKTLVNKVQNGKFRVECDDVKLLLSETFKTGNDIPFGMYL